MAVPRDCDGVSTWQAVEALTRIIVQCSVDKIPGYLNMLVQPVVEGLAHCQTMPLPDRVVKLLSCLGSMFDNIHNCVRVVGRSVSPRWGSIRFRLAPRTYDAPPMWALSTCGA